MSDGNEYNLNNILTNLALRVGQMEGQLKSFQETWARQDQLAHNGRQVVYERIELLSRQVERVATDIGSVQQDVAELKKEVDEEVMPTVHANAFARERRAGAKGMLAVLWGGLVIVISALAYAADKLMGFLFPRP